MADNKALFGHVAVDLGFISEDQLVDVGRLQNDPDEARPLGELLVELGWIDQEQLQQILAEQWRRMARSSGGAPSADEPPGTREPSPTATDRSEAPPQVATRPGRAVDARAPSPPETSPAASPPAPPAGEVAEAAAEPEVGAPPHRAADARLTVIESLLRRALESEASDVHLHSGSRPRFRVHGRLEAIGEDALGSDFLDAAVDELLSSEQRAELDTSGQVDLALDLTGIGRFRVNVYRQQKGPDVVLRVIRRRVPDLQSLGLPADLARFTTYHQGLVLITGPAGCGKTTTLAALVEVINHERRDHVITAEDPIEYVFPPQRSLINQRQVGRHSKSFPRILRAALREDPDVIVLGELRDLEAVSLALTAAETGHLVLGTLHTGGAIHTINRLIGSFPANEQDQVRVMMAESLKAVISQRLVPRADGNGRVPAVEILVATRAISNLIREKKVFQIESLMQTGRSKGMRRLSESLRELVQKGVITADEARRHA